MAILSPDRDWDHAKALTALALIAGAGLMLAMPGNHDNMWMLLVAERLMDGASYGQGVSEVNPPTWAYLMMPGLWLADPHVVPVRLTFPVIITTYLAVALAATAPALKHLNTIRPRLGSAMLVALAIAMAILPLHFLGQRDHLAGVFLMPLVFHVATFRLAAGHPGPLPHSSLVLAGLALAIKPHFVLIAGALLLARHGRGGWQSRSILCDGGMMSLSTGTCIALIAVYDGAWLHMLPTIADLYGSYATPPGEQAQTLLVLLLLCTAEGLAVYAIRLPQAMRWMFAILIGSQGLVGVVYLVQAGFTYHLIPAWLIAPPLFIAIFMVHRTAEAAPPPVARAALIAACTLIVATAIADVRRLQAAVRIEDIAQAVLPPMEPGTRLLYLGSNLANGALYERALSGDIDWVSRSAALWMVPGIATLALTNPAKADDYRACQMAIIMADIAHSPPTMVMVETVSLHSPPGQTLNILEWLSADPAFSAYLQTLQDVSTPDLVQQNTRLFTLPPANRENTLAPPAATPVTAPVTAPVTDCVTGPKDHKLVSMIPVGSARTKAEHPTP